MTHYVAFKRLPFLVRRLKPASLRAIALFQGNDIRFSHPETPGLNLGAPYFQTREILSKVCLELLIHSGRSLNPKTLFQVLPKKKRFDKPVSANML